jgi:sialate O-acetylesterase
MLTRKRVLIDVVMIGALFGTAATFAYRWVHRSPLRDINGDGRVVVVCFGDSITAGGTRGCYPDLLRSLLGPSVEVVNAGRYGEQTKTGEVRLREVLDTNHADYVIVLEGLNDGCESVLKSVTMTTFELDAMAIEIRNSGAIPLIGTVYPPARPDVAEHHCFREMDEAIGRMVKKVKGAAIVDFAGAMDGKLDQLLFDGFHPNAEGSKVLAQTAYDALLRASANEQ